MGKFVEKGVKKAKNKDKKDKKVKKIKEKDDLKLEEKEIEKISKEIVSKENEDKNIDVSGPHETTTKIKKKKDKNKKDKNLQKVEDKEREEEKIVKEDQKDVSMIEENNTDSDDSGDEAPSPQQKGPPAYDSAEASRTIFVGNLAINTKKTHMKKYFGTFGAIKTIRFRTFHGQKIQSVRQIKNHPCITAYVVFEKDESAIAAQEASGKVFRDSHIRVMMADGKKKYFDGKRTVFVGNLTYATTDDNLFEVFQSCGEIKYVRTLRTSVGCKGTAYVCFKNPESVGLALELNQTMLHDRPIRVERYKNKPKIPKGVPDGKKPGKPGKLSKDSGKKAFQKKTGKSGRDFKSKTEVKRLQKGPKSFNQKKKPEKTGGKLAGKGSPVKNKVKKNKKHRSTANMKLAKKLNPQLKKSTKPEK